VVVNERKCAQSVTESERERSVERAGMSDAAECGGRSESTARVERRTGASRSKRSAVISPLTCSAHNTVMEGLVMKYHISVT